MLFDQNRNVEPDEPIDWPQIIYNDSPGSVTNVEIPDTQTQTSEVNVMNEKSDGVCNCVREPCECSVQPFPSATTPPPLVKMRYVYERINETEQPRPTETKTVSTSAATQNASTPEILGLPWYVVVGGAALALWMMNSNGGK